MTASGAYDLFKSLHPYDVVVMNELTTILGKDADSKYIEDHFQRETLHVGSNLSKRLPHVFTSAGSIPGLYEALSDSSLPHSEVKESLFGEYGTDGDGDIRYIAPDYVLELFNSLARTNSTK